MTENLYDVAYELIGEIKDTKQAEKIARARLAIGAYGGIIGWRVRSDERCGVTPLVD
ncbi:hypothetical protein [Novipirellula caenicola]|uniref:hypothetical protein n=1 Tax=Novipirellula caenicola TaxID=1536901 RepID=UPI0031E7A738